MAAFKPAVAISCCLLVLAILFSTVAAADVPMPRPAEAKTGKVAASLLPNPLGSGLNSPIALGRTPKYGRRFLNLMKELVDAARGGNLNLAQSLQEQLFALTRPKHHRRHMLEQTPGSCSALATPVTESEAEAKAPASKGPAAAAAGPLPDIRFATMAACAEYSCRDDFALVKEADGAVACKQTEASQMRAASLRQPPVEPIVVEDFAYFQVFDYDFPADTDGDNVLAGLYAGTVLSTNNEFTSERGAIGLNSGIESDTQIRAVPNPLLGVRADTTLGGEVGTGVEVSRDVGDIGVFNFETTLQSLSYSSNFGGVVPGTVVVERGDEDEDPSDDNVAIRTNIPALWAYGKK